MLLAAALLVAVDQDVGALPTPARLIRNNVNKYLLATEPDPGGAFSRVQSTVSPGGKIINCEVVAASGAAAFGEALCKGLLASRATPARDAMGQAIYGTFSYNAVSVARDAASTAPPATDMSLVVNHMPAGSKDFERREAALTVDAAGKVSACRPLVQPALPLLDTAMCSLALHRISVKAAQDEAGQPVASIQLFSAEFSGPDAPTIRKERLNPR